jgi:hypothetical protein
MAQRWLSDCLALSGCISDRQDLVLHARGVEKQRDGESKRVGQIALGLQTSRVRATYTRLSSAHIKIRASYE